MTTVNKQYMKVIYGTGSDYDRGKLQIVYPDATASVCSCSIEVGVCSTGIAIASVSALTPSGSVHQQASLSLQLSISAA